MIESKVVERFRNQMNRFEELDKLEYEILTLSGYTLSELKDLFAKGYTMEYPKNKDIVETYDEDLRIRNIASHYGLKAQSMQCIEECAELIQAINKYLRKKGNGQSVTVSSIEVLNNVIEEIADVYIMLEQMIYLINGDRAVNEMIDYKLNRSLERIEEENARR